MASHDFKTQSLCISDEDLRLRFRELTPTEQSKTTEHGQRKLSMMLLESLLEAKKFFGSDDFLVLIVGAAPGRNTYAVAQLLKPQKGYFLYDPAGFDITDDEAAQTNIKIYKQLFDDDAVNFWKNVVEQRINILFISDIRSDVTRALTKEKHIENERKIYNNMLLQQKWVEEIKPGLSVLKFRPYFADVAKDLGLSTDMVYLKGYKICKGIWTHPSSAEGRLFVIQTNGQFIKTKWDVEKYEDQMFYHNSINRLRKYNTIIKKNSDDKYIYVKNGVPELINDWDSNAEAYILIRVANEWFSVQPNSIYQTVTFISDHISNILGISLSELRKGRSKIRTKDIPFEFNKLLRHENFNIDAVVNVLFPGPENKTLKENIHYRKEDLIHITPFITLIDIIRQIAFRIEPGSRKSLNFRVIDINAKTGSNTIIFALNKTVIGIESIIDGLSNNQLFMQTMALYENRIDKKKEMKTYIGLFSIMFENNDISVKDKVLYFSPELEVDMNDKFVRSGLTIKTNSGNITYEELFRKIMIKDAKLIVFKAPHGYQIARLKLHQFQVEEYPVADFTFFFIYNIPLRFTEVKPNKRVKDYIGSIDVKDICSIVPIMSKSTSGYGMSFYCTSKNKKINGKIISPVMNNTNDRMIFEYAVEDFGFSGLKPKMARGNFLVVHSDIWELDQGSKNLDLSHKEEYEWIQGEFNIDTKITYNIKLVEISNVCLYLVYDPLKELESNVIPINFKLNEINNDIIKKQIIKWFLLRYYFGSPYTEYSDLFIHNNMVYSNGFNRFKSNDVNKSVLPKMNVTRQDLKDAINDLKIGIQRALTISTEKLNQIKSNFRPSAVSNAIVKYNSFYFGIHMTFSPNSITSFLSKREGKLDTISYELMMKIMGQ